MFVLHCTAPVVRFSVHICFEGLVVVTPYSHLCPVGLIYILPKMHLVDYVFRIWRTERDASSKGGMFSDDYHMTILLP